VQAPPRGASIGQGARADLKRVWRTCGTTLRAPPRIRASAGASGTPRIRNCRGRLPREAPHRRPEGRAALRPGNGRKPVTAAGASRLRGLGNPPRARGGGVCGPGRR